MYLGPVLQLLICKQKRGPTVWAEKDSFNWLTDTARSVRPPLEQLLNLSQKQSHVPYSQPARKRIHSRASSRLSGKYT